MRTDDRTRSTAWQSGAHSDLIRIYIRARAYIHSHVIRMAASSISGFAIISLLICWSWDPPRLVKARLVSQNERFLAAGKFIHEVHSEYGVLGEKVRARNVLQIAIAQNH